MRAADDGVLIFVGFVSVAGEGFGEPVGGADEGGFGVEVLVDIRERGGEEIGDKMGKKREERSYHCALLLAGTVGALVQGGGTV